MYRIKHSLQLGHDQDQVIRLPLRPRAAECNVSMPSKVSSVVVERHDQYDDMSDAFKSAANYMSMVQEMTSQNKEIKTEPSKSVTTNHDRKRVKENRKTQAKNIQVRTQKLKEFNEKIQALNKQSSSKAKNKQKKKTQQIEASISQEHKENSQSKIFVERFQPNLAQTQEESQNCTQKGAIDPTNNSYCGSENELRAKNSENKEKLAKKSGIGGVGKVSFSHNKLDRESAGLQMIIDKVINAGIRVGALCSCSPQSNFTDVNFTKKCCQNCELFNRPERHRKLLERLLTT